MSDLRVSVLNVLSQVVNTREYVGTVLTGISCVRTASLDVALELAPLLEVSVAAGTNEAAAWIRRFVLIFQVAYEVDLAAGYERTVRAVETSRYPAIDFHVPQG